MLDQNGINSAIFTILNETEQEINYINSAKQAAQASLDTQYKLRDSLGYGSGTLTVIIVLACVLWFILSDLMKLFGIESAQKSLLKKPKNGKKKVKSWKKKYIPT